MKLILVIGQPGAGKSHFVKNNILNKLDNMFVYDVYNYEYPQLQEVDPTKYRSGLAKYTGSDTDILFRSIYKFRNTCFVLEDATIFLDNSKKEQEFKRVIYGRRHSNVMIVLLFHSINRVPIWIFEQSNIITLFKTQDMEKKIRGKLEDRRIFQAYKFLQKSKNPHEKVILEMF